MSSRPSLKIISGGAASEGAQSKSPSLLIATNSAVNRIVFGRTATAIGLNVIDATTESASALAASHRPDGIMIDCDGSFTHCEAIFATVQRFAEEGNKPYVIMVALEEPKRDDSGDFPVDAFIAKPITTDRLQSILYRLL